jgi:hypothetical protein
MEICYKLPQDHMAKEAKMKTVLILALVGVISACAEPTMRSTVTPVTGEKTPEGGVRFNPAQSSPPPIVVIGEKEARR